MILRNDEEKVWEWISGGMGGKRRADIVLDNAGFEVGRLTLVSTYAADQKDVLTPCSILAFHGHDLCRLPPHPDAVL